MKFADNQQRNDLDIVYVRRTKSEMEGREKSQSNLWEFERKMFKDNLYSTPVRDIKIGESIYDKQGKEITYRTKET